LKPVIVKIMEIMSLIRIILVRAEGMHDMIVSQHIRTRLEEIEKEHDIQILYACESGSRAWGFASPDSDYDVRFIFRRGIDGYLVIKDLPDTLIYPIEGEMDYDGWDLKKFLLK